MSLGGRAPGVSDLCDGSGVLLLQHFRTTSCTLVLLQFLTRLSFSTLHAIKMGLRALIKDLTRCKHLYKGRGCARRPNNIPQMH